MAESASGQGEGNPVFDWLPELILPARDFPRWSRKNKFSFRPYNKSFIDQASVKMAIY